MKLTVEQLKKMAEERKFKDYHISLGMERRVSTKTWEKDDKKRTYITIQCFTMSGNYKGSYKCGYVDMLSGEYVTTKYDDIDLTTPYRDAMYGIETNPFEEEKEEATVEVKNEYVKGNVASKIVEHANGTVTAYTSDGFYVGEYKSRADAEAWFIANGYELVSDNPKSEETTKTAEIAEIIESTAESKKTEKPSIIEGKYWNKKIYGKAGSYNIYLDNKKVSITDTQKEELDTYVASL